LTVKNLVDVAGLPLGLDENGRLIFGDDLPPVEPQARTLEEMRVVLYNQTATMPEELYYMYRNVGRPRDVERIAGRSLRFDVTVLVAGLVGGEFVKTAGHYHPVIEGGGPDGLTYPELYQVVSGRAHYLLQRPAPAVEQGRGHAAPGEDAGGPGGRGDVGAGLDRAGWSTGHLADVVIVDAGPGDVLYVPPGYGHVTINPGPEPLVMVNVVDGSFSSVYWPYRERHGAAYYEIEEHGESYFVANDHYPDPPEPRLGRPTGPRSLGLRPGVPLYRQLVEDPEAFGFLSRPAGEGPRP